MISDKNFALWNWNRNVWLLEIYSPDLNAMVACWKCLKPGPGYGVNHYRRQYFIPSKKVRWVCKKLGISVQKNPNRVRAGKHASENHPVGRG